MSKISAAGTESLKKVIDDAVKDPSKDVPGLFVAITNNKGEDLFSYTAGYTGADGAEQLTEDNIFWIASCTKLIATVAILQLVEQKKLNLDDADHLESILPELKNLPIATLEKDGTISLKPKKNKITLRMLLTHTSGLGYSFFNDTLKVWSDLFAVDDFDQSTHRDVLYPLLFEPGTNWEYGVGIDWAGEALKRVTGVELGEYIDEHIFKPLNMKDSSFTPDSELRKKLVKMSHRSPDGVLSAGDHIMKKVIKGDYDTFFHSGGAGIFSRPTEYVKVLATILNDGTSPNTGAKILSPETVSAMFQNQVPEFPNLGRKGIPASIPALTNPIPDVYPQGDAPQGWGLSWFLTLEPGATGRGANTGFWCGLSNLFYWCDKEKGIAGMVAGQALPFGDANILGSWVNVESTVYANLE